MKILRKVSNLLSSFMIYKDKYQYYKEMGYSDRQAHAKAQYKAGIIKKY